jgi:AcrR family transcriptional regulator
VSAAAGSRRTPYVELARGVLREQLLDGVGELLRDRPWAHVTMAEVAEHAGVSRQTLYNTFGSREELARSYVDREADRFMVAVDAAVRVHAPDPRAALAAAFEIFLAGAGEHPLARAIVASDGSEELLPLLTTRGGPLIDRVTSHLTDVIIESWPALDRADAAPVADALVRLAISHAALPSGDPAATANEIAGLLGPRIDELLSSSAR